MDPISDMPERDAPGGSAIARPDRTSNQALARMRFDVQWCSSAARHTDCLVATDLDLSRDLFPPRLEAGAMDKPGGHRAEVSFAPGELLAPRQAGLLVRLRCEQFNRRSSKRVFVEPRPGRFYPRGLLTGVDGVPPGDRLPVRIVEVGPGGLLADLNHPLADKELIVSVALEDIRSPGAERCGRRNEIGEMICANGPGMQGRWRDQATDFWSDLPWSRIDSRPDTQFYAQPRFVDHLDSAALSQVRGLYGRLLPEGGRILDLMSSWHSHLPDRLAPASVVGLGLNAAELGANLLLSQRIVQDLNERPLLPFEEASFDAAVCTVSVEYLTRPFEVFREVARVLRPGGRFVVTFSNRWFPPKVIEIWKGLHEFERPGLVSEYFLESGRFANLQTWSLRGLPRPADDKYAAQLPFSDPVYAVWAQRR